MNKFFNIIKTINDKQPKKTPGRPVLKVIDKALTLEDAALMLKQQGAAVAILAVQDLQAYWLGIMQDSKASNKDKLAASKLYAQSIGAFDAKQQLKASAPEAYKWADAEVIEAESNEPEKPTT